MSTQINVTVGSGGLPDKAKQQQQAARQAQLEKERQRRIEAEGAAQRAARLAAEGQNAQGQPLAGSPEPTPRQQDEPAATRTVAKEDYLFLPKTPVSSRFAGSINEIRYNEKASGFSGLTLCTHVAKSDYGSGFILDPTQYYSANEGPNSSSAHIIPRLTDLPPLDPFGQNANRFYALKNQRLYEAEDGSRITPTLKPNSTLAKVENFTCEFFLRFGDATAPADFDTYNTLASLSLELTSSNYPNPPGVDLSKRISIDFGFSKLMASGIPVYTFGFGVYSVAQNITNLIGAYGYEQVSTNPGTVTVNSIAPASTIYSNTNQSAIPPILGTWAHFACVKRGSITSWYINGVLLWKLDSAVSRWDMRYIGSGSDPNYTPLYPPLYFQYEVGSTIQVTQRFVEGSGIHGVRFTTKALYQDGFTPPLNL